MNRSLPDKDTQRVTALRIAVILGAGGSGRDLLERVKPLLGHERNVEMQGVFIEEAELQYAAELPFVQELCRVTFNVREFTNDQFEKALALRIRTARRALELLASREGVRHSFRSVRGAALNLLRETAESSDVTLFEPPRLFETGPPMSSRSRKIVAVVTGPGTVPGIIRAALGLAGGGVDLLSVLILPKPGADTAELKEAVRGALKGHPVQTRVTGSGDAPVVAEVARQLGASMLVLPADAEWVEPAVLRRLRDELNCPVCLVRRRAEDE